MITSMAQLPVPSSTPAPRAEKSTRPVEGDRFERHLDADRAEAPARKPEAEAGSPQVEPAEDQPVLDATQTLLGDAPEALEAPPISATAVLVEMTAAPVTAEAPIAPALPQDVVPQIAAEDAPIVAAPAPEAAPQTNLAKSPALIADELPPLTSDEVPATPIPASAPPEALADAAPVATEVTKPLQPVAPEAELAQAEDAPLPEPARIEPAKIAAPKAPSAPVLTTTSPASESVRFDALLSNLDDASGASAPQALSEPESTRGVSEVAQPTRAPQTALTPLMRNVMERMTELEIAAGKTRIMLRPQGMGIVELDLVGGIDGVMRLTIRAENPLVLETLKQDGSALSGLLQDRGFDLSGGTPEFERYVAPETGPDGTETGEDAGPVATADAGSRDNVLSSERIDILT